MNRILIVVRHGTFESAWKERDDPHTYELVIVDHSRNLVDNVVAVAVPEWYQDLDAFVADEARNNTETP